MPVAPDPPYLKNTLSIPVSCLLLLKLTPGAMLIAASIVNDLKRQIFSTLLMTAILQHGERKAYAADRRFIRDHQRV